MCTCAPSSLNHSTHVPPIGVGRHHACMRVRVNYNLVTTRSTPKQHGVITGSMSILCVVTAGRAGRSSDRRHVRDRRCHRVARRGLGSRPDRSPRCRCGLACERFVRAWSTVRPRSSHPHPARPPTTPPPASPSRTRPRPTSDRSIRMATSVVPGQ